MLTGLFVGAILLLVMGVGGAFVLPFLIVGALIWLVVLPFRILFHVVFGLVGGFFGLIAGIGGALLGVLLVPLVLLVVGVALVGAFLAVLLAFLTPLVPVFLLVLLGWGVYRLFVRPAPAVRSF